MYNQDIENKFYEYVTSNYDINNPKIYLKLKHTYEVVKVAERIAYDLNLDKENIELAKLIALFHDIGRFEQAKQFDSFNDATTVDHAALGVDILFKNNFIRNFIPDDKYDTIIKVAILNHNKYEIDKSNLTELEIFHSKIIRDADKTDIFQVMIGKNEVNYQEAANSPISAKVYQRFLTKQCIPNQDKNYPLDKYVACLAFIFDYNFTWGLKYLKEQNYINKLIDKFNYYNVDTKKKMEEIREIALAYIEEKITS